MIIIIKEIYRQKKYDAVIEYRDGYYVEYFPLNFKKSNIAQLNLICTSKMVPIEIAELIEKEFVYWISKYPIPLMVMAFNEDDSKINLKSIRNSSELIGYMNEDKVIKSWDMSKIKIPDKYYEVDNIYGDLLFKSVDEMENESKKYIEDKINIARSANFMVFIWVVIGIGIALLGFANSIVGGIACIYSIYKAISKFYGSKSKMKIEKQKKMDKMRHYYYHCELNPRGFDKLKAENFLKDKCINKES